MPAIERPSLLTRLRYSKVSELLHGRISSGTNPAQVIARAELDASTKSLIADICKRTRLWNDERVDVANELIAHFLDAKDAGVTSEKAIRAFGDPDAAARLIRRAKIRNRSPLWHVLRFLRRAAGVLVLLYLGLAIYFSLQQPRISVDYITRLNEPILKIPQDQRAWPYYRQLGEQYDARTERKDAFDIYPSVHEKQWPKVVAWLKENDETLALIDQATARPHMGFIYGDQGSIRDMKKYADRTPDPTDPFHNALLSVLLPQLNYMRQTANILASDARLAAEQKDADRWMKRVHQMHVVAEHSAESGFLIGQLVQIGIEALRLDQIQQMLVSHRDLLSDQQLTDLAHQNAMYRKPSDLMSFKGERMMFYDIVQRIYTDDGKGDGHVSTRGISNIEALTSVGLNRPAHNRSSLTLTRFAISPAAALLMASRKDLVEKYDYYMNLMERNIDTPWRDRRDKSLDDEIIALKSSFLTNIRYVLISILLPSLDRASLTTERALTMRDASQVGIALELYRRRNGSYPASLNELAPRLLPSVPLDPADGKPMKYKLVDGKPLIYSVGSDLDDDGGMLPAPKPTAVKPDRPVSGYELAIGSYDTDYEGDWLLYPEYRAPEPDPEEEEVEPTTLPTTEPAVPADDQ